MNPSEITLYIEKLAAGKATAAEKHRFLEWLYTLPPEKVEAVMDQYHAAIENAHSGSEVADPALQARIEAALDKHYPDSIFNKKPGTLRSMHPAYRIAAACIVLLLSCITIYYVLTPADNLTGSFTTVNKIQQTNGLPGGNKAVLTLADKSEVVLDDVATEQLTQQGNARIINTGNGRLVYNDMGAAKGDIAFNTLTTPKGGQFALTLADGTKVWLNAASSIRYPATFTEAVRKVYVTGEVYFEVVHNRHQPFVVVVNDMEVEDIGTSFNINAYDNEAVINTTLVEGEVKITRGNQTKHLLPGQQSWLDKRGNLTVMQHADIELATAWKNGFTRFKSADIQSIMRQVERWYDIDIVYEGKIPERTFTGGVSRSADLAELLRILELSNIHFKREGKQLIVTP